MKAEDIARIKELLPTSLGSNEIRENIAADILRRSIFSSRMTSATYLAKLREVIAQMLEGSISQSTARDVLEGILDSMGHSMQDGGGLTNPASIRRLNLIVETQTQMASSVAKSYEQTASVVNAYPAWALMRLESRQAPREDWLRRWSEAGAAVGWVGAREEPWRGSGASYAFVALKSSPIWGALGNGAGGFKDTLGNPYPPFAYSSGMGWEEVDRETAEELGLVERGEELAALDGFGLDVTSDEIAEVAKSHGFDFNDFAKDLQYG